MSKRKNSSHSRAGGNPDENDYKEYRGFYTFPKIKCVLIAESPPARGTYFYFPDGAVTENLFSAVMEALYKKVPQTKREGLDNFKKDGYLLVDSIYKPINRYKKIDRIAALVENLPNLLEDLKSLKITKKTPIILISRRVLDIIGPLLVLDGKNVLNKGDLVPFPAYGRRTEFIRKLRKYIRKLK